MEQITIAQWQQWKEDIRRKLEETAENFVYIGYRLKQIEETEAYKADGYKDLNEFAQAEYGLGKSTVSRFIAINNKFSIDGNSQELRREAKGLGFSKLSEMLTLSELDCQLITEKTTVKTIRELKQFNHAEPSAEDMRKQEYTPLQKCIIDFMSNQSRHNLLNEIVDKVSEQDLGPAEVEKICEQMNPSGSQTHKKGIVFLFLNDIQKGIQYRLMTDPVPRSMSWPEFIREIFSIYVDYMAAGQSTWCNFYGPLPKEEEKPQVSGQLSINTVKKEQVATSQQKEKREESPKVRKAEPLEEDNEEEDEEEEDIQETEEGTEEDVEEEEEKEIEEEQDIVDNMSLKLRKRAKEIAEFIQRTLSKWQQSTEIPKEVLQILTAQTKELKKTIDELEANQVGENAEEE